jgi:hypothetical protein
MTDLLFSDSMFDQVLQCYKQSNEPYFSGVLVVTPVVTPGESG